MSVVTNVIVTGLPGLYPEYAGKDPPHIQSCVIDGLNHWLLESGEQQGLRECSAYCGGTKNMETHVWMGGFNYLCISGFVEVYRKILAEGPQDDLTDRITLMICRQDDDTFEIVPNAPDGCNWDYRQRANDIKNT